MLARELATAQAEAVSYRYKFEFTHSMTNTYAAENPELKILVERVHVLGHSQVFPHNGALEKEFQLTRARLQADGATAEELRRRTVYHGCTESIARLICEQGLKPADCYLCKTQSRIPHDAGYLGNHSQGVYVSKHADYTLYYCNTKDVKPDDDGVVVVLECVTGKMQHFKVMPGPISPTPGYHSHEGSNQLEYYLFNPAQAVPRAVIHWKAIKTLRAGIKHAM